MRSSYQDNEEAALALRNRNRRTKVTRGFLDWRYTGEVSAKPPELFWVESPGGTRVGLAGIVYRPYWFDGRIHQVAVLGDIALDEAFRGQRIGIRLFQEITDHLRTQKVHCALVIPNAAARPGLLKAGWLEADQFLWHVWHRDATRVMSKWGNVAKRIIGISSSPIFSLLQWRLRRMEALGICYEEQDHLNYSLDQLWAEIPKHGLIIRDRTAMSLRWRFMDHPCRHFRYATFKLNGNIVGSIVFRMNEDDDCIVYDLLIGKKHHVRSVVSRFICRQLSESGVRSVRIKLNAKHPLHRELWNIVGFVRRKAECILINRDDDIRHYSWFMTGVDKDT